MTATMTTLTPTDPKLVTLLDGPKEIAQYEAEYRSVAGRASLLRSALRRIQREIDQINEAVDAEEDGAEELYALLPALRIERSRIALRLDPVERDERDLISKIESFGIRVPR